jgi:1,4-alpha-glucan branching enzyme
MKRCLCVIHCLLAAANLTAAERMDAEAAATSTNAQAAANLQTSVTFAFTDPEAQSVHLAGEFNRWLDNVDGKISGQDPWRMKTDGAGHWTFTTNLPPGHYRFKYVMDGGERWAPDPNRPMAPDGNSMVFVKGPLTLPPATATGGVAFVFLDPKAKTVHLAGEFNHWDTTAHPLKKDADGKWSTTIQLEAGKHPYKFIVDGEWRLDPLNPDFQDDGAGNLNSIRSVAP